MKKNNIVISGDQEYSIYFHGSLGEEFGEGKNTLYARSIQDAFKGLSSRYGQGFVETIQSGAWHVGIGDAIVDEKGIPQKEGKYLENIDVLIPLKCSEIHIFPLLQGEGGKAGAGISIVIGLILIATGLGAGAGAASIAAGTSTSLGAVLAGIGSVIGGIVGLTTSLPDIGNYEDADTQKTSFLYNGTVNVIEQGGPVPLVFGLHLTGSTVISASIYLDQIPSDDLAILVNKIWNPDTPQFYGENYRSTINGTIPGDSSDEGGFLENTIVGAQGGKRPVLVTLLNGGIKGVGGGYTPNATINNIAPSIVGGGGFILGYSRQIAIVPVGQGGTFNSKVNKVLQVKTAGHAGNMLVFTITILEGVNANESIVLPDILETHGVYDFVTNEHKAAKDFVVNDILGGLASIEDGLLTRGVLRGKITNISSYPVASSPDEFLYNLSVDRQHTFIVKSQDLKFSWLVHNGGVPEQRIPREVKDTLQANAVIKVLEVISEGEIKGFAQGLSSVFIDGVRVENDDGSLNFQGILADFRLGTASQEVLEGFETIELTYLKSGGGIDLLFDVPVVTDVIAPETSSVNVVINFPTGLKKSDPLTGDSFGTEVSYTIEVKLQSESTWTQSRFITEKGAASAAYEIEHRIAAPSGYASGWSFRVTRNTPNTNTNTSADLFKLVRWTEFSAPDGLPETYPNTALMGIHIPAKQVGSSIPVRGYEVFGLIVDIPSNYNPDTRIYTGVWDGTFKKAWTDNTAWVLYALLVNKRWGIGRYLVEDLQVNKWAFYDCSVYNDEYVSDGQVGTEPRYTFNGVIANRQSGWQLLHAVASNMRASIGLVGSEITVIQDRPGLPKKLLNNTNVVGGTFVYSTTDSVDRTTVVNATYNDSLDKYLPRTLSEEDSVEILKYGRNVKDYIAYGVTSESYARRMARWVIFTETKLFKIVNFAVALNVVDIAPGDIISIADDSIKSTIDVKLSGRVKFINGASVELDAPVDLTETGYTFSVANKDYDGIIEQTIISPVGLQQTLTLSSALPAGDYANHEFHVYKLGVTEPEQYRISSIKEEEIGIFKITATLHDPLKYSIIEDGLVVVPNIPSSLNILVPPITGLAVTELYRESVEGSARTLLISWDHNNKHESYTLAYQKDDNNFKSLQTTDLQFEILDPLPGVYTIRVRAVGITGGVSPLKELIYNYRILPSSDLLPPINLFVENTIDTIFNAFQLSVVWDYEPLNDNKVDRLKDYILEGWSEDGLTLFYSQAIPYNSPAGIGFKGGKLSISKRAIVDVFGFAPRDFQIKVYSRDLIGDISIPTVKHFTNPAPVVPTVILSGKGLDFLIKLSNYIPAEDATKIILAVSGTSAFSPTRDTWYSIQDLVTNTLGYTVRAEVAQTYYIRIAIWDEYEDTELNWTGEFSVTLQEDGGGAIIFPVPGIPTNLSYTETTTINDSGEVLTGVKLTWDAPTAPNDRVSGYTIGYRDFSIGETIYKYYDVSENFLEVPQLASNKVYRVIVRANFGDSHSPYTTELNVSTTGDTTPTSSPTNLTSTNGFEFVTLNWTNPPEPDLKHIQIWFSTTDDLATANVVALTPADNHTFPEQLPGQVGFFWIRAVDTSGNFSGYEPATPLTGVLATTENIPENNLEANVITKLDNGASAFNGTVIYRTNLAPSTLPVPSGITITENTNGTRDIKIEWLTYTQGAVPADYLVIFVKEGHTDLTINDSATVVNVNTLGPSYFLFQGVDPNKDYRAGIAAIRAVEGIVYVTTIVAPTVTIDWRSFQTTPNFTGNIDSKPASEVTSGIDDTLRYRTAGAPSNTPSIIAITPADIIENINGSRDIILRWNAYVQGTLEADYIVLFYKEGLTPPTIADTALYLSVDTGSSNFYTFFGIDPTKNYIAGLAAGRLTNNGIEIGAIQTIGWTVTAGIADFKGTIDGETAASIAAVGSQTTNYRQDSSPSNDPVPSGITVTKNADGSNDILLTWSYVQGTLPADGFIIYYRVGTGTVVQTDASIQIGPRSTSYIFRGIPQDRAYRAGITAYRRTEAGIRETANIVQPIIAPDWRTVAIIPDYTGTIDGVNSVEISSVGGETINYRQDVAPDGVLTPTVINIKDKDDGSRDVVLFWAYTPGSIPHDGFNIYYREGTSTITTSNPSVQVGPTSISYIFQGLPQSGTYRAGITAYRRTESGIKETLIQQPFSSPDWRVFPQTPDYLGTIDGESASSISAVGSETVNYRQDIKPTANPIATGISSVDNTDGSRDITLFWSYTDGTIPADGFNIYYKEGSTTLVFTDESIQVGATSRSYKFQGVPQARTYKAGITAFRRTETGIKQSNTIISPTSSPNWTVFGTTAEITGNISGVPAATVNSNISNAAITADWNSISNVPPGLGTGTNNDFTISTINPSGGSSGDVHFNSSTNVTWFNYNGVWTRGGTVDASEVTTGILTAARIGANSITADKINVSTLAAVSANLGTVTAGNIFGSANLNISGQAIFSGNFNISGFSTSVQASAPAGVSYSIAGLGGTVASILANSATTNGTGLRAIATASGSKGIDCSGVSRAILATCGSVGGVGIETYTPGSSSIALWARTTASGSFSVLGQSTGTSGIAVGGTASQLSSVGVEAENTGGGTALAVKGKMTINTTSEVANLNSNLLQGLPKDRFCNVIACETGGNAIIGGNGFTFQSFVTSQEVFTSGGNDVTIRTVSDSRIKQDILDETLGLDFINSLIPKTYRLIENPDNLYHGFIAQDVELLEGLVEGDVLKTEYEDGMKGVDYLSLISPMVKAIQELKTRIEILENENKTLRG